MQVEYIKRRGLKGEHFQKLILEYLYNNKKASEEGIDNLLSDVLPGVLDEKQRKNKIHNLFCAISKKDKAFINQGSKRYPSWVRNSNAFR